VIQLLTQLGALDVPSINPTLTNVYELTTSHVDQFGKLAGVSQAEFINHLGALKIPIARYAADELAREVTAFT
jgi:hypothetical protein